MTHDTQSNVFKYLKTVHKIKLDEIYIEYVALHLPKYKALEKQNVQHQKDSDESSVEVVASPVHMVPKRDPKYDLPVFIALFNVPYTKFDDPAARDLFINIFGYDRSTFPKDSQTIREYIMESGKNAMYEQFPEQPLSMRVSIILDGYMYGKKHIYVILLADAYGASFHSIISTKGKNESQNAKWLST